MKISASTLFLASITPASAFITPSTITQKQRCAPLQMSDIDPRLVIEDSSPPRPKPPQMSTSLPFMECNPILDGTMAGDVGFDPLGLAKSTLDLKTYREAEIKHARLAMLAAAGWPVSELFDKKIAAVLGMNAVLDSAGRVPSVLNGGLEKISPFYWIGCVVFAGAADLYGMSQLSKKEGYVAGDFSFDPFGLMPKDEEGRKRMQTAEIKNGRLAMIAITAFAAQEFVTHIAIVDQAPIFFKPIWQVVSEFSQSGYSMPDYPDTPAVMDAVTQTPPIDAAVEAAKALSSTADTVTAAPLADAVSEAATAVSPPVAAVSPIVEAPTAVVAPPAPVSLPVDDAELVAAKKRIAELESKLNMISGLVR